MYSAKETEEIQALLINLNNLFARLRRYKNQNPTFRIREEKDNNTYLYMYLTQVFADGELHTFQYRRIRITGDSAQGILFDLFDKGDVV